MTFMRIAIYSPGLGLELGGASTLEKDLFSAFLSKSSKSEHEFLVYTHNASSLAKRHSSKNLRFVNLPPTRWRTLRFFNLLNRLQDALFDDRPFPFRGWFEKSLRREGAQVVYYTTNRFEPCDIPFIYTILDIENMTLPGYPEITENGEWERRRDFYKNIAPKAVYVVAANEAGKKQIQDHLQIDPWRIFPLPYFSPSNALAGAQRELNRKVLEKYGVKQPYVYYPAKVYAHKNHVAIVHALKDLKERHGRKLQAVFTGPDGGNRHHVEAVARKLGVADSIYFLGLVAPDEVVDLYKGATAMSYMSHFGPSNIPALEAMALGCPVINANVVGADEELGGVGILVNPHDEKELSDALLKLMNEPAYAAEVAERGRQRSRRWTAEDYMKGIFKLFDQYANVRRVWP